MPKKPWPIGLTIIGTREVWKVQIDGRGGDSECEQHFATKKEADDASFVDGPSRESTSVKFYVLSDGTLLDGIHAVRLSKGPTTAELVKVLSKKHPVLARLFERS